ncbi:molybdate ABC transporter substrate-binding protein [Thalassomonas sp. M1454]|uniref:molybdate ABC transporter substrate-binding protein n=1 Tax=Thalassomonas sp. M1454 TaxID=2594477 RepID=UPI00117E9128|nr:molybdate ABC transporter substrate-binding protein [Thalassomonas sp. M1454]TRX53821.1 molybdate ABC transporter substrate-binding protein [Thalassomonas sp. M1454]
MVNLRLTIITLVIFLSISLPSNAQTLRIAVSANFAKPVERLAQIFSKSTPIKPQITVASTGVLYQQIRHGAPFDLFFAADIRRPQLLEEQGLVFDEYRKTYAIGQIALWSATSKTEIQLEDLRQYKGRIAIAGPHIAPYGLAAKEALISSNLWSKYDDQLIVGNNINQTYQQIFTGAVKFGFISYSQLLDSKVGNGVLIDQTLHHSLEQQMVVLKNAENIDIAAKFFEFVLSKHAQEFLATQGYLAAITVPKITNESTTKASDSSPTKEG